MKEFNKFKGRNAEATPLREALDQMYKSYRISGKFNEMKLISSWEQIMGKSIASRTKQIYVSNKILYVKISSAPLKNELAMSKNKILKILEGEGNKGVIDDIRFL